MSTTKAKTRKTKCHIGVNDDLMIRFAHHDKVLMNFLGMEIKAIENLLFGTDPILADAISFGETQYTLKKKDNRDKGQRQFCGCVVSKDIGEYNTCPHLCEYCYANANKEVAVKNWKQHENNRVGETIKGRNMNFAKIDFANCYYFCDRKKK